MDPELMQAAFFRATGGPQAIENSPLPRPTAAPGSVLVRVAATAVNHVDTFVRSGAFATELVFPQAVGRDLVGVVEAADPAGGAGFARGDAVWSNSMGFGGRPGAAAQFAAVPRDRLYRLPDGVDPVQAAAVLHSGATAYLALHVHGNVRAGETVFVGGAAGGVGSALLVQAVRAGATVVASARAADLGYCRSLGASAAIDYASVDFAARLRGAVADASGGRGLDIHIETSGRHQLELAVDLLAQRGRIVALSGLAATNQVPLGKLYTRDGSIRGFAISNATVAELASAAGTVNELLADGSLRARDVTVLPLSAAASAHASLESGTVRAKLVLVP
jgi:NADPH:quinone reductase-like Zn-dependent oxidoreductase